MKVNFGVFNKLIGMLSGMLVALLMTSCLEDDTVEPVPVAYVSFFHASPDAPGLDVVLDNELLFDEAIEYTNYSGYLRFYTGNRELEFSEYNASNVLADTTFNFQPDKAYSVFLIDEVEELSTLIVEDSTETPASGKTWARFIHLSPDAPAVDFTVGESNPVSFTNRSFKQASTFTELDADDYSMILTATGSDEALVSVPETELKSGGVYTIIARGFVAPPAGNSNGLSIQVIRHQ